MYDDKKRFTGFQDLVKSLYFIRITHLHANINRGEAVFKDRIDEGEPDVRCMSS